MICQPKRRWLQFSVRTLLVFIAMVGCFLAGWKARDIAGSTSAEAISIDGVVMDVDENTYTLSVGSDDAVAEGTAFTVSRGGKKIGDIVVLQTAPDRSIGYRKLAQPTLIERILGPSMPAAIQAGDAVRATISREQLEEIQFQNGARRHYKQLLNVR